MIKYGLIACLIVSSGLSAMDGQPGKKRSAPEPTTTKTSSAPSSEDTAKRLKVLEYDIKFKGMYRLENSNKKCTKSEKELVDKISEIKRERTILELGAYGFTLMGARESTARELSALEGKSLVLYKQLDVLSQENDSSKDAAKMARAVSSFVQEMMELGLSFDSVKKSLIRIDND